MRSVIPGSTLQRVIPVCVKHKDDCIIISCEGHQPVVEAFTEIFDSRYVCWFLGHLLQKNHSIYQGYLASCIIWCRVHLIFWLLIFLWSFCCCQRVEEVDQLWYVQAWQDCTIWSIGAERTQAITAYGRVMSYELRFHVSIWQKVTSTSYPWSSETTCSESPYPSQSVGTGQHCSVGSSVGSHKEWILQGVR